MDYLRSCYKSDMRLYFDRPEVLTPGAWHWCPPGAIELPYWSAFVSSVWDYWLDAGDTPEVGEVSRGAWFNGAPDPRLKGQGFCGGPAVWLNGVPFGTPHLALDAGGVPVCCGLAPPAPVYLAAEDGRYLVTESGTEYFVPE